MPWYVWMCFLTVPVPFGVGCTLASDRPDDPGGIVVVGIAAAVWVFAAVILKNRLRQQSPDRWVRWWLLLAVVLPFLILFAVSTRHDPGVCDFVHARMTAGAAGGRDGLAASAPARHTPSWAECRELFARLQPRAVDFVLKLFTAMPPVWWFVALGVGWWRGK